MISNEVRFNESFFPRRNRQMIDDHLTNLDGIDVVSWIEEACGGSITIHRLI